MRTLVFWPVGGVGGVQRYDALLSKALLDLGHEVHLLLPRAIRVRDVEVYHGVSLRGTKIIPYGILNCAGPYCDLVNSIYGYVRLISFLEKYDIIFLDSIPPSLITKKLNKNKNYFYYIHGAVTTRKPRPILTKKINRFLLINIPNIIVDYEILFNRERVFANSMFTAMLSRHALGYVPEVLYPPVDVEKAAAHGHEKELAISMFARFSAAKGWEFALNAFNDVVKKCGLDKTQLYLLGAVNSSFEARYVKNLISLSEKLGIRNKIKVIVNPSLDKAYEILGKSMAFMHVRPNEPFGIVVVEAMAVGSVPVVHRSGGPWFDIVNMGKYGYGFAGKEEAVESLCKILTSDREFSRMSRLARTRAMQFSYQIFKDKIKNIISRLTNF